MTDRNGVAQFVVSLFVKQRVRPGERAPKGEEIKVTLATDPGEGFDEDTRVELVDPRINSYQIDSPDGRSISGWRSRPRGQTRLPRRLPAARRGEG